MSPKSVTIYHNPRCGKSRDTLALLQSRGLNPSIVEYLKDPPSASEIANILKLLKVQAKDIVRKKEASEIGIDPNAMTESQLCAAISRTPIIMERPIVVVDKKAALGRPPENVIKIL